MTTYITMLCISVASTALEEVCLPMNTQDICAAGITQAVEELYPAYGLALYVGCQPTNIVTTSPRPRPKPEVTQ
jgi:hypothetical protein